MNKVIVNCLDNSVEVIPLTETEILELKEESKKELERHKEEELLIEQRKKDKSGRNRHSNTRDTNAFV